MSDNTSQTNKPNEQGNDEQLPVVGGWHAPSQRGMWQQPAGASQARPLQRVSALPKDLDEQPQSTGDWHLPKAEDTVYRPEDEIEIAPPEDVLSQPPARTEPEPPAQATPLAPEDELFALAKSTGLLDDESAPQKLTSPEDMLALLDRIEDDEALSGTNTMRSELFALTNLAQDEDDEEDSGKWGSITPVTEDTSTLSQTSATDPESYAASLLSELDDDAPAGTASPKAGTPDDYAADLLRRLGDDDQPALTDEEMRQDELARQFAAREQEVRELRQALQRGEITQEQFASQLQQMMILDDDQVWWVMGADTDHWYKYVNNQWVLAEPPRLRTSPTMRFGDDQYLQDERQPSATGAAYGIGFDDDLMPRQGVSINDPDLTQVGSAFMESELRDPYSAPAEPVAEATVVGQAQPVDYGGFDGIETPFDQTEPPSLDERIPTPIAEEAQERYQSNLARTLVFAVFGLVGLAVLGGALVLFAATQWYSGVITRYEAQIAALQNYQPTFLTVSILDYAGNEIATLSQGGDQRIPVSLNDISPNLIHAVISMENPTFYDDPGWNIQQTVSTFFTSLGDGLIENPQPTITQQVARRFVLGDTNVRQTTSSVDEIAIAGELTNRYSKNFILQLYLNEILFGNQSFGIEAASQFYFEIPARELNLPQAALLAGLIDDPITYDPVTNRELSFARMEEVLTAMVNTGCLDMQHGVGRFCVTQQDRERPRVVLDNSLVRTRDYFPRSTEDDYPHFIALVRAQLEAAIPDLYSSGIIVQTTLVPEIQDRLEAMLNRRIEQLAGSGITTGAIMWVDPRSGAVRAYVGSHDFNDEENRGSTDYIRSFRNPGEAILPILYAGALDGVDRNADGSLNLDEYYTLASIVWDVPTTAPSPNDPNVRVNIPGTLGPVSVRVGLQNSLNAAAVDVFNFIGAEKFATMANRMGGLFERLETDITWRSALGETPVRMNDLVAAYTTIASGGKRRTPHVIDSIRDRNGNVLPVPAVLRPPEADALSPQIAFLLQNTLSDDSARNPQIYPRSGPLTLRNLPTQNHVAAATGTSDGNRDLWTIGFTSNAVVGVWLGRPDAGPIQRQTGFTAAAPLWNEVMSLVAFSQPTNPPREFTNPGGVGVQPICPDTGAATGNCPSPARNEFFAQGRPPSDTGLVRQVTINSWTRELTNDFCPATRDAITITVANITNPAAIAWLRGQGQAFAQRIGLPRDFEALPLPACSQPIPLTVELTTPANGQVIVGEITVRGQISAPPNFNRYQLEISPAGQDAFRPLPGFPQTSQQPAPDSPIGVWNTEGLNGEYQIRLIAFSNEGGFVSRTNTVTINNPTPTPPPTPTPTNTPEPVFTPLPFDTPIPFDPIVPPPGGDTGGVEPTIDPF